MPDRAFQIANLKGLGQTPITGVEKFFANQAKWHFDEFIDRAQKAPVRVMRRDRVVGVMVSAEDYEAMRAFYADRLQHTLQRSAVTAAAAGLDPEKFGDLLADEN